MASNRMSDKPWWTEAILKFGIPAAIACYLVWTLAEKVDNKLDGLTSAMSSHAAVGEHQARALDKLIQINIEQCINSAATAKRNPKECLK